MRKLSSSSASEWCAVDAGGVVEPAMGGISGKGDEDLDEDRCGQRWAQMLCALASGETNSSAVPTGSEELGPDVWIEGSVDSPTGVVGAEAAPSERRGRRIGIGCTRDELKL